MILGAHESIAGGVSKAFERAEADTAECLQIFTKNARGWAAKPLDEGEIASFKAEAKRTGFPAIAHCTYLVNLAAEDSALRQKSRLGFADELERCTRLDIPWLVLHPGAHADASTGIRLIAEGLDAAFAKVPGPSGVLLEVTAGQGTSIGHQFGQIAAILDATQGSDRLGICLDTCHLYAAGYDIGTREGYDRTLKELDQAVGLCRVKAIHLNDCLKPLGCRVDRHEEIGEGELGLAPFGYFLADPRLAKVLGILETPEPEKYKANLKKLRALAGKPPSTKARR
ncbi:MAG: deoxyribonuclease IV [Deltaproteobacteria bacterium]|nr:deoxyribonuclease IV [Deltaproteobacteria bacterium]